MLAKTPKISTWDLMRRVYTLLGALKKTARAWVLTPTNLIQTSRDGRGQEWTDLSLPQAPVESSVSKKALQNCFASGVISTLQTAVRNITQQKPRDFKCLFQAHTAISGRVDSADPETHLLNSSPTFWGLGVSFTPLSHQESENTVSIAPFVDLNSQALTQWKRQTHTHHHFRWSGRLFSAPHRGLVWFLMSTAVASLCVGVGHVR